MKLYRFSPIQSKEQLIEAIKYVHFNCHKLCKQSFGIYLQNAGNVGIFCHFEDEYKPLIDLRKELTETSLNKNQKYFKLHNPIIIEADGDVPETTYTHLYIRKPDPYRFHVGDVDFYVEQDKYFNFKKDLLENKKINGARIFERPDLDMIELFDPNIDVLAYVSFKKMTELVRIKQSDITKL